MGVSGEQRRVSIVLEQTVKKQLKELAEKDKRSLSKYISIVLEKHLEETKKK